MSVFKVEQVQALAFMSFKFGGAAYNIGLVFFGFYRLLIGYLIFRSAFLLRILDALMGVPWLKKSESPEYIGRAVATLAGDPHMMRKTGKALHVGELAHEYRCSDIDGRRVSPFRIVESFVNMVKKLEKRNGPTSRR